MTISFSGRELVVPTLRVGDIKHLVPAIQRISAPVKESPLERFDQLDDFVDVIHVALQRNYPDLSKAELLEILELPSMMAAFRAAMGKFWGSPAPSSASAA